MTQKRTYIGVYAPITDSDHVLLAQKGGGPYTGAWDLPGGGIEFGEDPLEALRREILEETGLTLQAATVQTALSHCLTYQRSDGEWEDFHHIGLIFRVQVAPTPAQEITDSAEPIQWFDRATVQNLPLTPFARAVLVENIL